MSLPLIDLTSIRTAGLSEVGHKILDVFESVLNRSTGETETSRPLAPVGKGVDDSLVQESQHTGPVARPDLWSVKAAAERFDALVPHIEPYEQHQPTLEAFLWEFWTLLIHIAQLIPYQQKNLHEVLLDIVEDLCLLSGRTIQVWSEDQILWQDLPLLGPCLREAWIDPTIDVDEIDPKAIELWRNLNHFTQLLWNIGVESCSVFALWQIRLALEEPVEVKLQSRILVGADWIVESMQGILHEILHDLVLSETELRALRPGTLYKDGKPGFNVDRWRFWRRRLEDIQKENQWGQEVKDRVRLAATMMLARETLLESIPWTMDYRLSRP